MKPNILLMDNNCQSLTEIITFLQKTGYDVDPVENTHQAVDRALDRQYQFLVLDWEDIHLINPGRLFHRLRTLHPCLKVVLMMNDEHREDNKEIILQADATLLRAAMPTRLGKTLRLLAG